MSDRRRATLELELDPAATADAAPLDLHEGISDPRPSEGCSRWPSHLRLAGRVGASVRFVKGRCRATNLCPYCRTLYTVETHEMLMLDALTDSPTCWLVLTAREHLSRADTYRHLEQLRRAAKRRWPHIEWHVQVEFQRRGALHLNLLVKGVPALEAGELGELLVSRWCDRVDALPAGQWAGAIEDGYAVSRYLAKTLAHGLKAEQAPPFGWRGHRTSQTRGYFPGGAAAAREAARASLRSKRALHRALTAGLSGSVAELEAELELERQELETWELVGVIESVGGLVVSARGVKA